MTEEKPTNGVVEVCGIKFCWQGDKLSDSTQYWASIDLGCDRARVFHKKIQEVGAINAFARGGVHLDLNRNENMLAIFSENHPRDLQYNRKSLSKFKKMLDHECERYKEYFESLAKEINSTSNISTDKKELHRESKPKKRKKSEKPISSIFIAKGKGETKIADEKKRHCKSSPRKRPNTRELDTLCSAPLNNKIAFFHASSGKPLAVTEEKKEQWDVEELLPSTDEKESGLPSIEEVAKMFGGQGSQATTPQSPSSALQVESDPAGPNKKPNALIEEKRDTFEWQPIRDKKLDFRSLSPGTIKAIAEGGFSDDEGEGDKKPIVLSELSASGINNGVKS